jgi:hypothetical protein
LTVKSNGGFYFSEEVGFEPKTKKNDKKTKGDKKDGKGKKEPKQKN